MPARGRGLLVDRLEAVERRHDVEQCQALDLFGVVARQTVGDPRAAVMAGDHKPLEAKRRHRLDLVERQRPLAVVFVVRAGRWLRAVAIAAQIRDHEGEFGGQPRRHLAPHQMRLGVAVQ